MNTERSSIVELIELDTLNDSDPKGEPLGLKIDLFKSVNVKVNVIAGKADVPITTLLAMKSGDVIALDTPADALVDITLDGKVIARGELVAVGDQFGVRITEVGSGTRT